MTYLDTHVLIWLYEGSAERLGPAARKAIGEEDLLASPMAVLELEFLHEIGRLKPAASKLMGSLAADLGLKICDLPFHVVVDQALRENWGRDPFDRLIVANAKAAGATLVSKDANILRHYARAVW